MLHRLGGCLDTGKSCGNCDGRGPVGASHINATVLLWMVEAREECMWDHYQCKVALLAPCGCM